jgi:hypothetical protein
MSRWQGNQLTKDSIPDVSRDAGTGRNHLPQRSRIVEPRDGLSASRQTSVKSAGVERELAAV